MNIVRGAARVVTETANATTAAAGALGGAAVNGVIGGVQGTVGGIRNGLSTGSKSTPAALVALGALGATGLIDWPVLLAVGGGALVVRQLGKRLNGQASQASKASQGPKLVAATPSSSQHTEPRKSATKASPRKSSSSAARTAPRKATKSGQARKASTRS
jgi:hypothetical protein